MKKNDFENEYRKYKEIVDQFNAIDKASDNDSDLDEPRARMDGFLKRLNAKGGDYERLFEDYKDARKNDNEFIDVNDNIWDENVPALIERFRRFGIDRFTFSSTWSSAVKTAWLFTENGCTLEGLTQINKGLNPISGEYEKAPAYVFSIQQAV